MDKKKIIFLILGISLALSLEQQQWWSLILFKQGEFHNDWWIFISEDIKSWRENGQLKVLYSTSESSALLVYRIWTILLLMVIILILIGVVMWVKDKTKK